jgi:hypothetical protein
MPVPKSCDCGWSGVVRDDARRPRCPECHAPLFVPPLPPEPVEAASGPVYREPSAEERLRRPQSRAATAARDDDPDWSQQHSVEEEPRRRKERYRPDVIFSRGTFTALGLLLAGGIWLAIDLTSDRTPIFSLILLTLGLIKLIFCFSGREED